MPHSQLPPIALALALLLARAAGGAPDADPGGGADADAWARAEAMRKSWADAGADWHLIYIGEGWANLSGGLRRGAAYDGLLKLSLSLDLGQVTKLAPLKGWSFYTSVLDPQGAGISNRYVGDYNILSNIDAYDTVRLFESYLMWEAADHTVNFRMGQLSVDNYFYVSDSSNLFINSAYGTLGTLLHDVIVPIYPVGSLGMHLTVRPTPAWILQAIVLSGDPGDQSRNNKNGLRFALNRKSGALGLLEAGYLRTPGDGSILEGKYKLGVFGQAATYPDLRDGPSHHGDYGIYGVVDQQIYRNARSTKEQFAGVTAFCRASLAPEDRNPVSRYVDAGLNFPGLIPGREKDNFGIAVSLEWLSPGLTQPGGAPAVSRLEHVIEATYSVNVSDALLIQPDLQYIINPGAVGETPDAFVAGLRVTVTY